MGRVGLVRLEGKRMTQLVKRNWGWGGCRLNTKSTFGGAIIPTYWRIPLHGCSAADIKLKLCPYPGKLDPDKAASAEVGGRR